MAFLNRNSINYFFALSKYSIFIYYRIFDLRTFFRYIIMVETQANISIDELENISISHLTIDDVNRITTQDVVDFLAFARTDLENNNTTRNRKLSSIKSLYKHLYTKKHLVDKNPTEAILEFVRSICGNDSICYDEHIAQSERTHAERNMALAYFMKSFGNIENDVETYLWFVDP